VKLASGVRLGPYEIVAPIGAGGMGEVYRAHDTTLGREVAIKVVSMDTPQARRRFEQEARVVAALSHPNILSIHHFATENGISFAVTELLQGQTLRERIDAGKLPWSEAVQIAASICDGLAAAHEKGIIHRDLKPSNIFLTSDGQVKILDFGLAQTAPAVDDKTDVKTTPGTVMGTLGYMSPEQLRGEGVDARTDIYALGRTLEEMTRDTTPPLKRIIRRCTETERNARYHSARDLAHDLRSLQTATPKRWLAVAAVMAAIIAITAVILRRQPVASPRHEIRSILVLPFENQSRDPGAEYLSDGIAEGLISKLAELPNVRVIARTTAFQFKGKPVDLPRIRKELGIDAVLSGRLLSRANNVIVQADLIDAVAGTELWGNRFHEESTDVLSIEQNIVGQISDALRVRLTQAQQMRVSKPATRNPEAYRLYLQGRFFFYKRTPESAGKARDLFTQAVTLDPQFALGYAGLANIYDLLGATFYVMPVEEGRRRAQQAAETALRLDPNLADAHAALGLHETYLYHWATAEKEFKRALEINPNSTDSLLWYSLLCLARGRIEQSVALMRRAEDLDPLSSVMVTNLAQRLNVIGDYAAALREAQRGPELDGSFIPAYLQAGLAYEGLGQREQAIAKYKRGAHVSSTPGIEQLLLARAAALVGDRGRANEVADVLANRVARNEVSPTWAAFAYSVAGHRDRAIELLNQAFKARDPFLRNQLHGPIARELWGDPRYEELLRRLERGLED
jgi:serine/threonine-protein kinase